MRNLYYLLLTIGILNAGPVLSQEVGTTNGNLSVSLSGAATYTIPIATPPGINGVKPTVSLTYNSQGANGLAGYGWSVSGTSTITRVPSTKFHDAAMDAVDFDGLDRFALDGQRLLLKSGTYGADGAEYQTENFSNIKITSHGVSPYGADYGPAYFLVQYPDGARAYYGNSSNSRSRNDWAITYWENLQNVRISYFYTLSNNTLSISSIQYGSVGTAIPLNNIQFIYKARVHPEQSFVGGISFTRNTILSEIRVLGNGTGFRNYVLGHDVTSQGYERLTSVTEKSGDNTKSYNPTVFTYDLTGDMSFNATNTQISLTNVSLANSASVQGDFDADGNMDVIVYPNSGSISKTKYYLFKGIQPNVYNFGDVQNTGKFEDIFPVNYINHNNILMPNQGWTVVQKDGNSLKFKVYASGGALPVYFQYEKTMAPFNVLWPTDMQTATIKTLSGDFKGTGYTDAIVMIKNASLLGGGTFYIDLNNGNTPPMFSIATNVGLYSDAKQFTVDFNGDGRTDIVEVTNGNIKVFGVDDNNQIYSICTYADAPINITRVILLGDYNGDGKMDLLMPNGNNVDSWNFYFSTGISYQKTNSSIGSVYTDVLTVEGYFGIVGWDVGVKSFRDTSYFSNDLNGDGKTDILVQQVYTVKNTAEPQVVRYGIWENKVVNPSTITFDYTYVPAQYSGVNRFPIPAFVNHNNANLNLEFGLISGNKIFSFKNSKDLKTLFRLKKITSGNGVAETITYQPLGSCNTPGCVSAYSQNNQQEHYPNYDVVKNNGFNVVSQIELQASSVYKKQSYKYMGAVTNVEGLGFLGFKGIMKTNWYENNAQMISNISMFDVNKRGALIEDYSVNGWGFLSAGYSPASGFINKTQVTYQEELLPNKVYKAQNTSTKSYNGLEGTSKEVVTYYDQYNNPGAIYTTTKSGTTTQKVEAVLIEYDNQPEGQVYFIGRPRKKNTETYVDAGQMNTEELYTYNASNLLTQVKRKGHNTEYLTEDNIFDAFGNITQKTITAPGLPPRITKYQFDASGRFIIKSTDLEGLETLFTHNAGSGLLLSETSPYGLTKQYEYDVWGKLKKVTDYLGKYVTNTYSMTGGIMQATTTGEDGSSSIVQYDDLGRKIISGYKNLNGSWSYIKTGYDIYNRIVSVSEPYTNLSQNPTQLTTTTYDNYGRVTQTVAHTGKITNISYSGLTTVANDGSGSVTSIKNAMGEVVSLTNNGGTITYQYYANGNLKQSSYNNAITAVEQDGWGRKTKLTDPSAGVYMYEYNHFGEITKETNPKGIVYYSYNAAGKIKAKWNNDNGYGWNIDYVYDPVTKQLYYSDWFDSNGETQFIEYSYDNYGRVTNTTEINNHATFSKSLTYDNFGRIENVTSTTSYAGEVSTVTTRRTYRNGFDFQVIDPADNKILWQNSTLNARGQVQTASFGNGITLSNTYDQYGLPSQIKHHKRHRVQIGQPPIPDTDYVTLDYTFNAQRGNLLTRSNSAFNWPETFEYDNLDRLTQYTNTRGEQEVQSYDTRGRITENNLGDYQYGNAAKPYQVTGVELTEDGKAYYNNKEGIFNDSAENNSGWTTYYDPLNITYDSSNVHSGSYSIKIQNNTTSEKMVFAEAEIPIDNSVATQYTYSAWVYSNGPQSELFLYMKVEGEPNTYTTVDNIIITDTGYWKYFEKTVLVPANIKSIRMRLDNNGSGNVWFDDMKIRRTSDNTPNRVQNVSYNMFKSPLEIEEKGVDRISFIYGDSNSRMAMYYGNMAADKTARPNRKFYSADGSVEIKHNMITDKIEIITYINGNGYNAPVVHKKDDWVNNYYYLHRDYQGTILAITDKDALVVEKRLFDAWGNIIRVYDGSNKILSGLTFLDRGYTGHEHLQSVALINMNARLYDPQLHRHLQPDNFVVNMLDTQAFNRYSYVMNNPLKYTDASGELPVLVVAAIIGAIAGAAGYAAYAIQTGEWSWGGFGMAILSGAAVGAITGGIGGATATSVTLSAAGNAAASSFAAAFLPGINVPIGDWSFTISPSIAFGNSSGIGMSFSVGYSDGNWSFSGGVGIMAYDNYHGFGTHGTEIRQSILAAYDDGKTGFSLGTNFWRGTNGMAEFKQQTGFFGFRQGDFKFTYENDGLPFGVKDKWYNPYLGDGNDSYRTAAASIGIGKFSAGFNLFTGKRTDYTGDELEMNNMDHKRGFFGEKMPYGYVKEEGFRYRMGAAYFKYGSYRVGVDSDRYVRHPIQDIFAHKWISDQPGFLSLTDSINPYFQYQTPNPFTTW